MIGLPTLFDSVRSFSRTLLLGGLTCVFGLSLLASGPAWAQDDSLAELATNNASRPAANGWATQAETVEKEALSEKLAKRISVEVEDLVLEEVLRQIAEKGGVELVYGSHSVLSDRTLTLRLDDVSVRAALSRAVEGTELKPMLSSSGYIVLIKQSAVADPHQVKEGGGTDFSIDPPNLERAPLALGTTSRAQQGTITGMVTDSTTGDPMPGVNVAIVGTQQGATTNNEGRYRIPNVETGAHTVRASFVGYTTEAQDVEIEEGETTTVNFTLSPTEVALKEMVVTALGIEREERTLSYSTQEVEGGELVEARELNVGASLMGRISGMRVQSGAQGVGSDVRMVIRGNRSFIGDSEPLIVVDGVPTQGGIGTINPDDVESIEILKGPNASALYGNEAQNGVVLVTTESPEEGEFELSFTENIQARRANFQIPFQNKYGQGIGGEYKANTTSSWGPKMEGQTVSHWSPAPEYQDETYKLTPQPNNYKDFFQTGWNSSTNLTGSVGTESIQGIMSYTYTRATGIVPNNDMDRHNFMVKTNSQPIEDLSLVGKLAYVKESTDGQLNSDVKNKSALRYALQMPRSIRTEQLKDFEYFTPSGQRRQNIWSPGAVGAGNPYWGVNRILNESQEDRVRALAKGTYTLTSNLDLRVQGSVDFASLQGEERIYNNTYEAAPQGYYEENKNQNLRWDGNALLSYDNNITENIGFNVSGGGNWRYERSTALSSNTGNKLTVPNFFALSNTNNLRSSEGDTPREVQSLFGRGEVSWNDAIFLTGTARNDWSSTLPPENWSFFYPSAGLSMVLTDLVPGAFPDFIDFAKVRGSWARVGNEAPPFRTTRTANFSQGGRVGFLHLSGTLPPESLEPEQSDSWEFGAQVRTFEDRLRANVTLYQTNTTNQLFTIPLPSASGASQTFTNGGNIENRGIEFELSGTPLQSSDFRWDTNVNFSARRNEVKEIHDERDEVSIGGAFGGTHDIVEGEPYGQWFGRGFRRDDQGRVVVRDDGIPFLTSGEDDVQIADFNPDWNASMQNSLAFRNFNFSFLIDHRQGGKIVSLTNSVQAWVGATKRTLAGREEGEVVFGEDVYTEETAVTEDGSTSNIPAADPQQFWRTIGGTSNTALEAFTNSATALKLREVRASYSLPQSIIGTTPISRVNVSLVGRNLFWIYKEGTNTNPDMIRSAGGPGDEGIDAYMPPDTRTFGLNINIVY